jgi:hypothetical protein
MKLFDIICSAQNGKVFANLGEVVGLDEQLTAQCVKGLARPLVKVIEHKACTRDGILALLDFFSARRYDRFLTSSQIFGHPRSQGEGERILIFLLEDPELVGCIVSAQQDQISLERTLIEALLPYAAIMVMGAMEHRLRGPLIAMLESLGDGELATDARNNPFAAMADVIRARSKTEHQDDLPVSAEEAAAHDSAEEDPGAGNDSIAPSDAEPVQSAASLLAKLLSARPQHAA